jgi:hypothetical protein
MSKNNKKKEKSQEEPSGKMKNKEFEQELEKLQVTLFLATCMYTESIGEVSGDCL